MTLVNGTRFGSYEVIALVGAGGMGEVYRARDTQLNRDVAIKILPQLFAADAERVARFQREAQVLASLNHPNIAHIHGLEETDGCKVLVLEFVDGPTLAELIAKGPIPLDEALPIARRIAEALAAAHEQGIIHRDLKPANIKVMSDGTVKVLDFGLAKADQASGSGLPASGLSMSPTIMSPAMTMGGVILGTAAYMSPEQARGKPIDKGTDIWAFGCVLYEMLTGRRTFGGEEVTDVLAFIITNEPDFGALSPNTPVPIRKLLRRCLEKDRRKRLADIADGRLEIEEAIAPLAGVGSSSARPVAQSSLVWVDRFGGEEPVPAPPRRYASARLSPDGTEIALDVRQDENDIWVWSLDRKNLQRVTSGPDLDRFPRWSPDGKRVLFGSARNNTTDNVYSHTADGTGQTERLTNSATAPHYPQSFSPDGSLIYTEWSAEGTNLQMLSKAGDARLLLRTPYRIASAEVSPDGRLLAYASNDTGRMEVYVQPFPNSEAERVLISTGGGFRPLWHPNGRELFYVVGTSPDPLKVMAVSIESSSPIKASAARQVIEGPFLSSPGNNMRTFDVSPDGKRVLMTKDARQTPTFVASASLIVILNWFDELRRVAPSRN